MAQLHQPHVLVDPRGGEDVVLQDRPLEHRGAIGACGLLVRQQAVLELLHLANAEKSPGSGRFLPFLAILELFLATGLFILRHSTAVLPPPSPE